MHQFLDVWSPVSGENNNMEYVIHSTYYKGFWNNDDGWSGDINDATRFTQEEMEDFNPPMGAEGKWLVVKYDW